MGTKNQRAVYECVNISDDPVYEWVRFFKGQVYEWGRFRNTDSHTRTKIFPVTPPPPPRGRALIVYVDNDPDHLLRIIRAFVVDIYDQDPSDLN